MGGVVKKVARVVVPAAASIFGGPIAGAVAGAAVSRFAGQKQPKLQDNSAALRRAERARQEGVKAQEDAQAQIRRQEEDREDDLLSRQAAQNRASRAARRGRSATTFRGASTSLKDKLGG